MALKRVRRPTFVRLMLAVNPASKILTRLMLRSYLGRSALFLKSEVVAGQSWAYLQSERRI